MIKNLMEEYNFIYSCLVHEFEYRDISMEELSLIKEELYPEKSYFDFIREEDAAPVVSYNNNAMEQTPVVKKSKHGKAIVYHVNSDIYNNSFMGKKKYDRFLKYLGEGPIHDDVVEYARKNPEKSIMICDENTGAHSFLKVGKEKW